MIPRMNERPRSVTVVSLIFIVVSGISFVARLLPLISPGVLPTPGVTDEVSLALMSAILAIAGGVFMLQGRNWTRWLCVVWMGLHVTLSFWHSPSELVAHALLFAAVLYLLFRPSAAAYFREATTRSS